MTYLTPGNPKSRVRALLATVSIIAIVFGIRLVDLQVVKADAINELSYEKRAVSRTLPALRGEITDSSGEVLARTVYRYDINAAPSKVAPVLRQVNGADVQIPVEQVANELATILDMTQADVLAKIAGTSEYSQIKKRVDAEVYRKVRALDIPWIYYDPIPDRLYPNGAVAGNVLGFLDPDGNPVEGVELQMNQCLAGQNGQETFEKGVDGIKIPSSAVTTKEAIPGRNVKLTINSDLQYFAQQVLTSTVSKLRADWATAVVIEAKTGKILVAAEAPSVDPNNPAAVAAEDRGARIFRTAFEPGSTLKTITAATLVDTGLGTAASQIEAPYGWSIPNVGYRVTDSHFHPTERLTLTGVLRDSSNTGIMLLGRKVPVETRYKYLQAFGLGSKTGVNFPGESKGQINAFEDWDGIKKYVSMFGQGVSMTPLQTAMMYQAVANKGVRLSPILVEGCIDQNGNIEKTEVKPGTRVISEASARTTIDMLEKVVEQGGIGKTAAVPGYRVGGKTGTAQIADPETGKYGSRFAISFIGLAPAENPEFVVAVTVYKPRTVSNSIGATPPFKRILEQVLRTYRVPPSTTKSANIPTEW